MVYVIATLFSATVWASVNRLILYGCEKSVSPTVLGYLIISTIAVAMTTFLAVILAVAVIE